jgi:3-oxoacyl-(acyl-carrier-protein) synthase
MSGGQRTAVITGVGVVAPGCLSFQEMGPALLQQRVSCSPIVRFCTDKFKTKLAFQVDQATFSDPSIPDAQRALIVQYGRRALSEALAMAGLDPTGAEPVCIFGTAVAGSWEMEAAYGSLATYAPRYRPVWPASDAVSLTHPGRVIFEPIAPRALRVVTTGCTAGLDALGVGWMDILDGADCVVVVSSEAPLGPLVVTCFDQINALTKETADQQRASQPYARQRSGFCIGEGAGAVVLEEARHAERRGARALGALRGYATTSSAHHMTAIHPSGEAIFRSLTLALEAASVEPNDIAMLVPHATSTRQNDAAEHAAFCRLFESLPKLPVFAGKANFGHALGASNLVEVVAAVWALGTRTVPPYPLRTKRDIEYAEILLPAEPRPLRGSLVAKNSSGFSGIHSAVILEGPPCT